MGALFQDRLADWTIGRNITLTLIGQWVYFFMGGCEDRIWEREAEESPLLEAVARERLVKTQHAVKFLAGAVVIGKEWRLAVAL
jgi:hypothetical protein